MRSDPPTLGGALDPSPRWVAGLLVLYFGLHVMVRLALPESLELDESEQLVLTQSWRWNYGVSNPPLYTWLQMAVFTVVGPGVLGLALLKELFLFLTFWFVYRAGTEMEGNPAHGLLAMCSVFFIPQFMWEAYRDLTHSLAVSASAAATLWLFLRLRRRPTTWGYLALGVAAGLGVLCKANYLVLVGAALGAGLVVPAFRPVVMNPRLGLTLLSALAVAGYPTWVSLHEGWDDKSLAALGHKTWGKAMTSMLWAALAFFLPGVAIYWIASRRRWPWCHTVSEQGRWLGWLMALGLLGCLATAMIKGVHFKDRLLLPLLIGLPLWLVERIGREWSRPQRFRVEALAVLVAVAVLVGLPASTWISSRMHDPNRRSAPFARLAEQLRQRVGEPSVIVAENRWLGGNLRMAFPGSVVEVPEEGVRLAQPGGRWVVVWNLEKRSQPPAALAALAEKRSGHSWVWEPVTELAAPYLYSENQVMRLGAVAMNQSGAKSPEGIK